MRETYRKIVQIEAVQLPPPGFQGSRGIVLYALCTDGTLWRCSDDKHDWRAINIDAIELTPSPKTK